VNPEIGRIALNIGILVLLLSIFSLMIVKRDSAEFIVDVIVIIITITFIVLLVYDVKRQVKEELLR
jgi:L-asparagine transporter-like permease